MSASSPSRPRRASAAGPPKWKELLSPEQKQKNKLPEAAALILKNHNKNDPTYPSLEKRRDLLAKIKEVPGAEWYTMHSVRDWFRHRRPPTGYEEKEEESSDEEEPQAVSETGKILQPSPSAAKVRVMKNRLPEAAASILQNHFKNEPIYPSLTKRKALLAEVHKVPGAEWYKLSDVNQWLNTRLKRKRDDSDDEALRETDKILWPSLNAAKIRNLEKLLRETPNPSAIHLQIWSRSLGAEQLHVESWVQLHRAQAQQPALQLQGLSQQQHDPSALPTPEGTASPELNSPRINTIPSLASPISSPIFQQTYIGYGVPAHIGVGGSGPQPYAALGTSFMAVQPSASSSSAYLAPYTPTSPIAAPSPALHATPQSPATRAESPESAEENDEGSLAATPVAVEEPPFMEPLLPPDTPSEANEDEEEVDELAETEGLQGSQELTEVPMITSTPSDHTRSEQPDTAIESITSPESTSVHASDRIAIDSPEESRPLSEVTTTTPIVELEANDLQEPSYEQHAAKHEPIVVDDPVSSDGYRSPPPEDTPGPMDVDENTPDPHSHTRSPSRSRSPVGGGNDTFTAEPTLALGNNSPTLAHESQPEDPGRIDSPNTSSRVPLEQGVHLRFSSPILPIDLPTPTPTSTSKPTPKSHQSPLTGKRRQKQTQKQKEREKLRFLRSTLPELPNASSASESGTGFEGVIGTDGTEAIVTDGAELLGTDGAEAIVDDASEAFVTDAPENTHPSLGTTLREETSTEVLSEVSRAGPSESAAGDVAGSGVTPSPTSTSGVQLRFSSPNLPSTSRYTPTPTSTPKPSPLAGTHKSILNQNFGQKEKQDRKEKEKRKARQKLRFLKSIALSPERELPGVSLELGTGSEGIAADAPKDGTALRREAEEPGSSSAGPSTPKPEEISVHPPKLPPHDEVPSLPIPPSNPNDEQEQDREQQQEPIPSRLQPTASSRFSSPFVPNELLQDSDDDDMDGRRSSKRQRPDSLSEGSGVASTTLVVEPPFEAIDSPPDRCRDSRNVTTPGLLVSSSSRSSVPRTSGSPSNLLVQKDEALERLLSGKVDGSPMECDIPLTSAIPLRPSTKILQTPLTLWPLPAEASEVGPPPPSTIRTTPAPDQPHQPPRSLFHDLCTIVLSNTPSTSTPPSTSWEELGECMEDCVRFYEAIEGGVYESFGLVPSKRVRSEFEGDGEDGLVGEEGEREEGEIEEGEIAEEEGEVEEAMIVDD